jgi:hypothetical protein
MDRAAEKMDFDSIADMDEARALPLSELIQWAP